MKSISLALGVLSTAASVAAISGKATTTVSISQILYNDKYIFPETNSFISVTPTDWTPLAAATLQVSRAWPAAASIPPPATRASLAAALAGAAPAAASATS